MAAIDTLTWDLTPARRPSLNDLGSAILEDKAGTKAPGTSGKNLYAAMCNQWQRQIAALARTASSVRLTIDFDGGGVPFIDKFQPAGTLLVSSDFALTDNGNGDTVITWTTSKLPPVECDPQATVNNDGDYTIAVTKSTTSTTTSMRVKTRLAGVLSNARFTISI